MIITTIFALIFASASAEPSFKLWTQCAIATRALKKERASLLQRYSLRENNNRFIRSLEHKELQLSLLYEAIDYAQTAFGTFFLEQSATMITSDKKILEERQKALRQLLDQPHIFDAILNDLHIIGSSHDALIAYGDSNNHLNKSIAHLFFDGSSMQWLSSTASKKIKQLNYSSWWLQLATYWTFLRHTDGIIMSIAKKNLTDILTKVALGITHNVSIDGFFVDGIMNISKAHMPFFWNFNPKTYTGDHKEYCTIFNEGTLLDKVGASVCGSHGSENSIGFTYIPFLKNIRYTWRTPEDFNSWDNVSSLQKTRVALFIASVTVMQDYWILESSKNSIKSMQKLAHMLYTLYNRLTKMNTLFEKFKLLGENVRTLSRNSDTFKKIVNEYDELVTLPSFKKILETIQSLNKGKMYASYGKLLHAHFLIQQWESDGHIEKMIRILGLLDWYCSHALLLIESNRNGNHWSFVEWSEDQKPFIALDGFWNVLIGQEKAIPNAFVLGNNHPSHAIITGPNGGGKSTILASLGHILVLAHTAGIAPAASAAMTSFHSIRTCFSPSADTIRGISQFMAEKEAMHDLEDHVHTCGKTNERTLLLIDEPYRGTVDIETGERIYTFGKALSQAPWCLSSIATHVYKPTLLAFDTNGHFANYQVLVHDIETNNFKQQFIISPGIAQWWFDDAKKRSECINCLTSH